MNRAHGFTLLELLLALAMGAMVLTGVGGLLLESRGAQRAVAMEARLQENLRFTLATLGRDLAATGHLGCGGSGVLESVDASSLAGAYYSDFSRPVRGHEATATGPGEQVDLLAPATGWSPPLPAELSGRPRAGTDVLRLQRSRGSPLPLSREKATNRVHLYHGHAIASGCGGAARLDGFCPGDRGVLSDCRRARIFTVSGQQRITGPKGEELVLDHSSDNSPTSWGHAGDPDWEVDASRAVVQPVATVAYYVANEVDGEPALYRRVDDRAEALVRGVESLQLSFGVDTTGDGAVDGYRTADGVGGASALTVQVALLLRSERPLSRNTRSGEPIPMGSAHAGGAVNVLPPADRRLRRAAMRTFALPNAHPHGTGGGT